MSWDGMLLKNSKNEILAAIVIMGGTFTVIAFRNKSYIDFDGFDTITEAKEFAERAVK